MPVARPKEGGIWDASLQGPSCPSTSILTFLSILLRSGRTHGTEHVPLRRRVAPDIRSLADCVRQLGWNALGAAGSSDADEVVVKQKCGYGRARGQVFFCKKQRHMCRCHVTMHVGKGIGRLGYASETSRFSALLSLVEDVVLCNLCGSHLKPVPQVEGRWLIRASTCSP